MPKPKPRPERIGPGAERMALVLCSHIEPDVTQACLECRWESQLQIEASAARRASKA